MTRLDDYRSALLVAFPETSDAELAAALDAIGPAFASFIIDQGLGPLWHARTGRDEFHESRLAAEALYLAQEHALIEIDATLESAGIEYAVFKGAASRLLLYENPAIRAGFDVDLLVRADDRLAAATALVDAGFSASPDAPNISRELVLSRGRVDVDLHWGLLREGRLRVDVIPGMLAGRERSSGMWMLSPEDAFFVLLVHSAFAKHLSGLEMGLHRVADVLRWLDTQKFDWSKVNAKLEQNGVQTAAWATLRWAAILAHPRALRGVETLLPNLRPGRLRSAWLNRWLLKDLSTETSHLHWARLLGFSSLLHDTPSDVLRAVMGRYRAHKRIGEDLEVFRDLQG